MSETRPRCQQGFVRDSLSGLVGHPLDHGLSGRKPVIAGKVAVSPSAASCTPPPLRALGHDVPYVENAVDRRPHDGALPPMVPNLGDHVLAEPHIVGLVRGNARLSNRPVEPGEQPVERVGGDHRHRSESRFTARRQGRFPELSDCILLAVLTEGQTQELPRRDTIQFGHFEI